MLKAAVHDGEQQSCVAAITAITQSGPRQPFVECSIVRFAVVEAMSFMAVHDKAVALLEALALLSLCMRK